MARNTSAAYKQQINGQRKYCVKVNISYADGTEETLTDLQDFMKIKIEDSCSGTSNFEIGAAVINEAVITLNNRSGKFSGKSFYGAELTVHAGIYVDGLPEYVKMGVYLVDEPVAPGVSIQLVAYDQLIKADRQYHAKIPYPATLSQIAEDACAQSGIVLRNTQFPNRGYIVENTPEEGHTCREMLSYVAQLAGCFVRCDADGQVCIRWYSDTADTVVQGIRSKNICTDTVTITGIEVQSGSNVSAQAGDDGYKLAIADNILIENGKEQEIADFLAGRLIGMSFRPLSVTCRSDPSIEAGDRIQVIDEAGTVYDTLVTSTTYAVMESQTVSCDAASPVVNSSRRLSESAKAIIQSQKYTLENVEKEKTERENAEKNFEDKLANSSGMYMTDVTQDDGSVIRYMHDKKKMEDSKIVWKITADAVGVSTDGGKTYPYGLDASGVAVLEKIYAIGLNADYITSGTIVAKDKDGNAVFSVNVETGEVVIRAETVRMESGTLEDYASKNDKKVTSLEQTAGQVSVEVADDTGTLSSVINTKTWEVKYVDANGVEISGMKFDPENRQFVFNGSGNFTGSINVADRFIVDVFGNARIYGGRYYAMDEDGNISSFTSMDKDGFTVYSEDSIPVIKIGFPDGKFSYPYVRLTSGEKSDEQSGIVKKFANGLWLGNDAPADAYGEFYAQKGYNGIFVSFEDGKTYVVSGEDMQNVYTGATIARFG